MPNHLPHQTAETAETAKRQASNREDDHDERDGRPAGPAHRGRGRGRRGEAGPRLRPLAAVAEGDAQAEGVGAAGQGAAERDAMGGAPVAEWAGWLCCGGTWERVAEGLTLREAFGALVEVQRGRGCWSSLHGAITAGGAPTFPPPAGRCLSHRQARPAPRSQGGTNRVRRRA